MALGKIVKKAVLAGCISGMLLTASGCYYGYSNYGYNTANTVKTTAAEGEVTKLSISDFADEDGVYQYKDLAWGSSMEQFEKAFDTRIDSTRSFTDGGSMADVNYCMKLLGYTSVGLEPLMDADGGLRGITIYFESVYTSQQLDELYDKAVAAAKEAFGDSDHESSASETSGDTTFDTVCSFWYHEIDEHKTTSFQIGKLDSGNGTTAVVIGANCYDPTELESESETESE